MGKIRKKIRNFAVDINTIHMTKKILFINQEMTPFVPETELSAMGRNIPQIILEKGHEVRTFMPKWGNINERRGQLHEVQRLSGMNIIINDTDHPMIIKCASIPSTRIQVFFIDNDDYFSKTQVDFENNADDQADNAERVIFYARGVLETVKKQRWSPDIIHCQGWLSYAIPLLVKTLYKDEPSFADTKVILSLLPDYKKVDINEEFLQSLETGDTKDELLKKYGNDFTIETLSKIAIDFSDGVIEAAQGVNPVLLEYAKNAGIPLLCHSEENKAETYDNFYKSISQ